MSAHVQLRCDACRKGHTWSAGLHSAPSKMRWLYRQQGWHVRPKGDVDGEVVTRDICDKCWKAGKR